MKVKSCPCCGRIEYLGIQAKFISNNLVYRVICNKSFNHTSEMGCGLRTDWFLTIQEAIEKWNLRTNNETETEIAT